MNTQSNFSSEMKMRFASTHASKCNQPHQEYEYFGRKCRAEKAFGALVMLPPPPPLV